MDHTHQMADNDSHFFIDSETRQVTTKSRNVKLMQYDHNSEIFTFEMPRYVEGHDMTLCNHVQVHYSNVGKNERVDDFYEVTDLHVKDSNDSIIIFTWVISRSATSKSGTLNFTVRFQCSTEETAEYVWNTQLYSCIPVNSSLYNSEAVIEQNPDAFLQIEKMLDASVVYDESDGLIEMLAESELVDPVSNNNNELFIENTDTIYTL